MEKVKVELEVPKEMNEVKILLVSLVADIKAKKSVAEIAAHNIPALMAAVEGFEKLGDEVKSEEAYNLAALLVADLVKVLKG